MRKIPVILALVASLLVAAPAMAGQAQPLGGLDLHKYCVEEGFKGAIVPGDEVVGHNTFNDWRCYNDSTTRPISLTQACKRQHGQKARHKVLNKGNAFEIICVGPPDP
ncbi:MAG TPA: hypothetical protein VIF43_03730 [Patescibacteria group bacterium]|jgi:hypothetical protein